MNITTFKKVLPFLLENKLSPWVWGNHGKGKTETIETYYKENDWLIFNFRLNTMSDVGDFLGLQEIQKNDKGELAYSKFCMPEWLKKCIDFCKANPGKRAGIFLDEINRAARLDLLGPIFQMSLDRKLHTYDFSMYNIDIISASNYNTKDYSLLNLKDKALMSRFVHINFDPPLKEFFTFAKDKMDSTLYAFLEENPEFVEEKDLEPFSISQFSKPDRRKWIRGVAKLHELEALNDGEMVELLSGLVGLEAALGLKEYKAKAVKPLTLEEILNTYPKVRNKLKELVEKTDRSDIVNHTVSKVIEFLQSDKEFTAKQGKNIIAFMEDLPNEHMWNVLYSCYNTKRFFEFCEKHKEKIEPLVKRCEEIKATIKPKEKEEVVEETTKTDEV
jgi:hypothetical protein